MKKTGTIKLIVLHAFALFNLGVCDHFFGATISFAPVPGKPLTGRFNYKAGWKSSRPDSPGCTSALVGQKNPNNMGLQDWKCSKGCMFKDEIVADLNYVCTAVDLKSEWEQGEHSFEVNFTGNTWPGVVYFFGMSWRTLSFGTYKESAVWNMETIVDLRPRSDISMPNSSPISLTKPVYHLQVTCQHTLRLPVTDPDGDRTECRFGTTFSECGGICDNIPAAKFLPGTCDLFIDTNNSNFTVDGWYALAIVVADYPRQDIILGGVEPKSTKDYLSTIPAQFLVHVVARKVPCSVQPVFMTPTPDEGQRFPIMTGKQLSTEIAAQSTYGEAKFIISEFVVQGPPGFQISNIVAVTNTYKAQVTWRPTAGQAGEHIVCFTARDERDVDSDTRCITIAAGDIDDCAPSPCLHGGVCVDLMTEYRCECKPGFTGTNCKTNIDDCKKFPNYRDWLILIAGFGMGSFVGLILRILHHRSKNKKKTNPMHICRIVPGDILL